MATFKKKKKIVGAFNSPLKSTQHFKLNKMRKEGKLNADRT